MNEKVVKWIVLGVIGLVFILIFRGPIRDLINRVTSADIDTSSGHIKIVTTPIGQTTVSAQKSPEAQYVDSAKSEPNTYVDAHYKFAISWPINSGWIPSTRISKEQVAALGYAGPVEDLGVFFVVKVATSLSPNAGLVGVYAYPKRFDNIQESVNAYINTIRNRGVTLLSSSIDQDTGGAVLVTSNGTASGVNRLLIGNTYEYVITMTAVPSSQTSGEEYAHVRDDTNTIFNSFRILN